MHSPSIAGPLRSLLSRSLLPLILVITAIVAGGWAILVQLGEREFVTDELNHHYAALAYAEGRGLTMPSGETYRRGAAISRAVAAVQQHVEDPRLAARLPSALLGIASLLLLATASWLMAGPWAAVWATTLLAIYPEAIAQSRLSRFYTLQLALGIAALLAGWFATVARDRQHRPTWALSATHWLWCAVAIAALYGAYRVQATTLSVAVAFTVWLVALAGLALRRTGLLALRESMPVQACAIGGLVLMGLAAAGVLLPTVSMWLERAAWAPIWADRLGIGRLYYVRLLSESIPWIISLLPIIALIAYRRAPRLTVYLVLWFAVPLVLHSLVFPQKQARYFLLPMPALFLLTGIAAAVVLGGLRQAIESELVTKSALTRQLASRLLVTAVGTWMLVTLPAFSDFRTMGSKSYQASPWRTAGELLGQSSEPHDLPWGAIDPLVALHFWGRVDFGVDPGLRDSARPPAPHHPVPRFPPKARVLEHDYYTGVPILTGAEELRAAYRRYGGVVIGLHTDSEAHMDSDLVETLKREADLIYGPPGRGVRLYVWRFELAPSESDRIGP